MSTRINCICRVVFMKIATPKKVRAKLWLPTNTRWSWTRRSRWHGPESRGRMSGSPRLRPRAGLKAFDAHLSSARDAMARALSIEPNLPEALLARASIETNFDYNWNAAAQTLSKALALAPADPNIVIAAGNLEIARGNMDRGIELYRKAVDLDPVNPTARAFLAFNLAATKRFAEAQANSRGLWN